MNDWKGPILAVVVFSQLAVFASSPSPRGGPAVVIGKSERIDQTVPDSPAALQDVMQAVKSRDLAKVKALVEQNPWLANSKDAGGRTPLHWACRNDGLEIVKYLVGKGADVNVLDGSGSSPLYNSISFGSLDEIDEILADHGADVDFSKGASLLFLAAKRGKENTVRLLLRKGADPNRQNTVGKTPLHIATEYNLPNIVGDLLANKADAAIKDKFGRTAVHQAAIEGYQVLVERLISAGIDFKEKDGLGKTPLDYAGKHGHKKLSAFLRAKSGLPEAGGDNFGPSPWLEKPLHPDEAVIWYLGHSGWAVKTKSKLLIFDYWERGRSDEPLLANGRINPEEIKNLDVYVFVSHSHEDHYDERIFLWEKIIKRISYCFGWKNDRGENSISLSPRETKRIGDMEVLMVNSPKADALDNAFLVKVDGISIYYPGDYGALGGITKITDIYRQDMEDLRAAAGRLDLMFLGGRLFDNKIPEYVTYSIQTAEPAVLFLMHQEAMEYNLKSLADSLSQVAGKTKSIAPLDRGQVFFYSNRGIRSAGNRP